MIYVYRRGPSDGARALCHALGARRLRHRRPVAQGDVVVCWGEAWPGDPFSVILNGTPLQNKLQDALRLAQAGVPTVEVSQTRPVEEVAPDPLQPAWEALTDQLDGLDAIEVRRDNPLFHSAIMALYNAIKHVDETWLAPPPAVDAAEWLGRLRNHVGGGDLLNPPAQPDYWVRKERLVREFRVHSFEGQSIRAGVKKHREGGDWDGSQGWRDSNGNLGPHPWIRSHEAGWRISYDGVTITRAHRDLAHAAVQALGLSFGAVDLGERVDGSLMVLEVNRAPGLEGGTVTAYSQAIQRWITAGGQS
jgi:hypothetical protein